MRPFDEGRDWLGLFLRSHPKDAPGARFISLTDVGQPSMQRAVVVGRRPASKMLAELCSRGQTWCQCSRMWSPLVRASPLRFALTWTVAVKPATSSFTAMPR